MKDREIWWSCLLLTTNYHQIQWNSMSGKIMSVYYIVFHCISWLTMKSYELQWSFWGSSGWPNNVSVFHGWPWSPMNDNDHFGVAYQQLFFLFLLFFFFFGVGRIHIKKLKYCYWYNVEVSQLQNLTKIASFVICQKKKNYWTSLLEIFHENNRHIKREEWLIMHNDQ